MNREDLSAYIENVLAGRSPVAAPDPDELIHFLLTSDGQAALLKNDDSLGQADGDRQDQRNRFQGLLNLLASSPVPDALPEAAELGQKAIGRERRIVEAFAANLESACNILRERLLTLHDDPVEARAVLDGLPERVHVATTDLGTLCLRRIPHGSVGAVKLLRKEAPSLAESGNEIAAAAAIEKIAAGTGWPLDAAREAYNWLFDLALCRPFLFTNAVLDAWSPDVLLVRRARADELWEVRRAAADPSFRWREGPALPRVDPRTLIREVGIGRERPAPPHVGPRTLIREAEVERERPAAARIGPSRVGPRTLRMPMAATETTEPVLVVLQLTGGNDYLNTLIPYNNPLYRDNRKAVGIPDNQIMHLDKDYGIPHYMAPLKQFWDNGKLAIMHGVGYANSQRSHFRSMDIWHTCEPEKVGTEGWLGRVAREFDPNKENVVTTVSFGPSLPLALRVPGVPVACVAGPLENYGFLPIIQGQQRQQVLDRFAAMYKPAIGSGPVMDYMSSTGLDSLKGEEILKVAPQKYSSTVQYPNSPIARKLKGIAQTHLADLGSRIFYCDHSTFDTHAGQNPGHGNLWTAVTEGLDAFMKDLREHDHADNVIVLMFSEFGRRVRDNGSGTDHGAGGVAFVLGEKVKGGHYGEMPSLKAEHLVQGDLNPNMDFRSVYSTILDKWLKLNPAPIVNGTFEQPAFLN